MQTLTYSQAAAAAVCFSNLASLTGAACAHTHVHTHTHTPAQHSLLCQCSSYLQHRFILCVPQDFWCTRQNSQCSSNTSSQLYLEVPAMTLIIYWFINFEVLLWLSYNDLICQVKGQMKEWKDADRLIEAASHVVGLLDMYEFTKLSGAHWPSCLNV